MKVRLLADATGEIGLLPAGTVIDHPDAYRLCQLGIAEALDDEAKECFETFKERQAQIAAVKKKGADEQAAAFAEANRLERLRLQEEFAKRMGL